MSNLLVFTPYHGRPVLTIMNNAVSSNQHGSVAKESTAASDGDFANMRRQYETLSNITSNGKTQAIKKWNGDSATRDASAVVDRRRQLAIAPTFIQDSLPYSTMTKHDNSRSTALTRVRAGGATVPKKCQMRKDSVGAPAPRFGKGEFLIRTKHRLAFIQNPKEKYV
jgi:hypothetical protein